MLTDVMNPSILIALAQMAVQPGRPADNADRMAAWIRDARRAGARLIVFPEMAVPGYLLGDAWEQPAFLRDCEAAGARIAAASAGVTVVFGNVAVDWARRNEDGRVRTYNALFVVEDGRWLGPDNGTGYSFVPKALPPNYREFDDSRHFYDLRKLAQESGRSPADLTVPIATRVGRIGGLVCEDAWDADYGFSPARVLAARGADLLVNISSSPYTFNKNRKRNRLFSTLAADVDKPVVYVNAVGLQNSGKTAFVFDGGSAIYGPGGRLAAGPAPFQEGVALVETPLRPDAGFGRPLEERSEGIADLFDALADGTRRFMALCGVSRVVVGVSGGIDSAVAAALYRRLLPPADLLLVNMPGPFTSARTRALARDLAQALGCPYGEIPIEPGLASTRTQLEGFALASGDGRWRETLRLSGEVLENVQARDRSARILAAVAAAVGGVFTCNANKSETTVGYSTLYGDLGGYFANLADLWKGEIYALARHLNERVYGQAVIPEGCFTVPPSAELSAAQDVEAGRGDPIQYPYHDCLFRSWVERWERVTPEEILDWYAAGSLEREIGYEGRVADRFPDARAFVEDLERWWTLYQGMGVAKRLQAPPLLALKRRAFGADLREAQLGARFTARYAAVKARLLGKGAP